ncbi:hypothetical protein Mth01_41600 [Sphaerimonospora thailandensis]|uniref:Uncharacterized protein n=1 Tax=Sphaerimonospora thailandensis TaxID=795644 RepID=A0A8J3RDL3_9ACTN|nr:hypothetical protein Mth01_41600 [Sphaerimonospora thailandensis]
MPDIGEQTSGAAEWSECQIAYPRSRAAEYCDWIGMPSHRLDTLGWEARIGQADRCRPRFSDDAKPRTHS